MMVNISDGLFVVIHHCGCECGCDSKYTNDKYINQSSMFEWRVMKTMICRCFANGTFKWAIFAFF